jgi:hypothetical protein
MHAVLVKPSPEVRRKYCTSSRLDFTLCTHQKHVQHLSSCIALLFHYSPFNPLLHFAKAAGAAATSIHRSPFLKAKLLLLLLLPLPAAIIIPDWK